MHDYLRVKTPTFYHSVPFNSPSSNESKNGYSFFSKTICYNHIISHFDSLKLMSIII